MINDAAAIVAYRMAVAAAVTGAFSLTAASLRFLYVGAGGVVVGLAVGWLLAELRRHIHDPEVENTSSLLTGYAAYLPAERLGVSGILAVVATGLYLGRVGPRFVAADTRVQNVGMWDVVVFVLEGLIFIITGLALRPILGGWSGPFARDLAWGAVLVSVTVVVARFVWVFPATYLPRWLSARVRQRDPLPPWQFPALVAWAGLRGAESLVLAAPIPTSTATGAHFPGRDVIIAITFAVILVTLLGQGFALPPLLRWLGVRETGEQDAREEIAARLRTAEAALARLDELTQETWMHPDALALTRDRYRYRARHLQGHADGVMDGPVEAKSVAQTRLARELLAAERRELLRLRDEGTIGDGGMRRVQREIGYEELLLRPVAVGRAPPRPLDRVQPHAQQRRCPADRQVERRAVERRWLAVRGTLEQRGGADRIGPHRALRHDHRFHLTGEPHQQHHRSPFRRGDGDAAAARGRAPGTSGELLQTVAPVERGGAAAVGQLDLRGTGLCLGPRFGEPTALDRERTGERRRREGRHRFRVRGRRAGTIGPAHALPPPGRA